MTVVMVFVLGLAADMDEYQHDDVGDEIGKRMDGIGQHRGTMSKNACQELDEKQYDICRSPHQRHLIYFLVSFHFVKEYALGRQKYDKKSIDAIFLDTFQRIV